MRSKSTKTDLKVSQKELMKQYESSNESNKAKVKQELQSYKDSVELLGGYKKNGKNKKVSDAPDAKVTADACYNSRAHIAWYLNVIETNYRNYSVLLEASSPKKARKLRIEAGRYRAEIKEALAKLEAAEKNALSRIPASQMVNSTEEKEKGDVGKKK